VSKPHEIVGNALYLTTSYAVSRLLGLVAAMILTRYLWSAVTLLITLGVRFGIYGALKATRTYIQDWFRFPLGPGIVPLSAPLFLGFVRLPGTVAWFVGLVLYCLLLSLVHSIDRSDMRLICHTLERSRLE
jgi:hypothetical protein